MGLRSLCRPEYVLRPTQLFRRLYRSVASRRSGPESIRLPWGWPIEVSQNDDIGAAVLKVGVYDLVVSEAIWRLCDAGETAIDIGANLGYMTSLLARRVGSRGRVFCFEAHPEVVKDLEANVARWRPLVGDDVIKIFNLALSDRAGSIRFGTSSDFHFNRGVGRVVGPTEAVGANGSVFEVPCSPLDNFLQQTPRVGVVKIDVEGHEEAVIRGSRQAIESGRIRDWIFEHHDAYPSRVTELFEANGYRIFQIHRKFRKPILVDSAEPRSGSDCDPPSFLATLDTDRAIARMQPAGWYSLC